MLLQNDRPENPAKAFLRRYRATMQRADALRRSIDEAMERATSTGVRLKPISVQNGAAAYDRMAEDVCRASDMGGPLYAALAQAEDELREILAAIDAVPDATQQAVLTMRYVEGLGWMEIAEKIGYEISNTYILHGRALWQVNQWLRKTL